MKKLLLPIALLVFGCSSDEPQYIAPEPQPESVTVLSYSFSEIDSNQAGERYSLAATVRNNTAQSVSGKVTCVIEGGSFQYIDNVNLAPNETKSVSQDGVLYFEDVPVVDDIYFE